MLEIDQYLNCVLYDEVFECIIAFILSLPLFCSVLVYHRYTNANIGLWRVGTRFEYLSDHLPCLWEKLEFIVFVKIWFPSNRRVFEFSWHDSWALAEIWVLTNFLGMKLSCDFQRLSRFPSEEKKFLFETVHKIFSFCQMLNGVKFMPRGLVWFCTTWD